MKEFTYRTVSLLHYFTELQVLDYFQHNMTQTKSTQSYYMPYPTPSIPKMASNAAVAVTSLKSIE